jgi:ABC-type amino acid transport substrate-binding protein
MPIEVKLRLWVIGAYLATRRWRWLLAAMIVVGVVVGGWGSFEACTPAATDSGGSQVPIWRLLAVGSALLPVLTLASPLQALEAAASLPYHRVRCFVLAGALATSSACILTGAVVGLDVAVASLIARALLAWFGLALVSGRVLGWSHSWVLPSAVMCVLLY